MLYLQKQKIRHFLRVARRKVAFWSLVVIPILGITFWGTYQINKFFDKYTLEFRSPVQSPIVAKLRPAPIDYEAKAQSTIPEFKEKMTDLELKICQQFGDDCAVMIAIARGESSVNPNKKNYNCMYGKESKSCDSKDIGRAWSVDCGLFQISVKGRYCPEKLLDPDYNIKIAKELKEASGLNSWVVYSNGSYLNKIPK